MATTALACNFVHCGKPAKSSFPQWSRWKLHPDPLPHAKTPPLPSVLRLRLTSEEALAVLQAEASTASSMLSSGFERISAKASPSSAPPAPLPTSHKYSSGFPALAYGVLKRANDIVDDLLSQIDAATRPGGDPFSTSAASLPSRSRPGRLLLRPRPSAAHPGRRPLLRHSSSPAGAPPPRHLRGRRGSSGGPVLPGTPPRHLLPRRSEGGAAALRAPSSPAPPRAAPPPRHLRGRRGSSDGPILPSTSEGGPSSPAPSPPPSTNGTDGSSSVGQLMGKK